jgi:hypothetical protein
VTLLVRDAATHDRAVLLALNNSAIPHVNELDREQFEWLAGHADYFRVAEDKGRIAGFVLAIGAGLDYWSLNYRWFSERYDNFLYLDRVVVAENMRRHGAGRLLYQDIADFAGGRWPRITLEVNLLPPNPGSMAFHEEMGFRRVGVREEDEGRKAVVMMER